MKTLKANGMNHILVKVTKHDYMDENPTYFLETFKDWDTAKKWEKFMQENYSGGTTHIQELTPEDLFKERLNAYWRGYEDQIDNIAQACDQNFVDCYLNEIDNYLEGHILRNW